MCGNFTKPYNPFIGNLAVYFFPYFITHIWYTILCFSKDEPDTHHLRHMDGNNIRDRFYLILRWISKLCCVTLHCLISQGKEGTKLMLSVEHDGMWTYSKWYGLKYRLFKKDM